MPCHTFPYPYSSIDYHFHYHDVIVVVDELILVSGKRKKGRKQNLKKVSLQICIFYSRIVFPATALEDITFKIPQCVFFT
jgi:hypothetical protein